MRHKKTGKFNLFKTLSMVLVVVFVLSIPLVIKKLIRINKLQCFSQYGDCGSILTNFQISGNYNDIKRKVEKILKENILVNDYLIQYKIPSTLVVNLNLKKPRYAIYDFKEKYYLLDKDGLILTIKNESNLPILIKDSYLGEIGQKVLDEDKFALKLIEKVDYLYSIKFGKVENKNLILTLKEGVRVLFPLEGDEDILVGSLRLIFSRLNDGSEGIKMDDIKEIDLRFKNAILR